MTQEEFNTLNENAKVVYMGFNGIGFYIKYDNGEAVYIHADWVSQEWDIETEAEKMKRHELEERARIVKENQPVLIIDEKTGQTRFLSRLEYEKLIIPAKA